MVYTLDDLKQKIAPIAKKYGIPAVYLFGSYARGDATDESDVDVLIQREGSLIIGWMIGGLYNDLQETLNKNIDLVTVESLEQHADRRSGRTFAENLMRERRAIYESA